MLPTSPPRADLLPFDLSLHFPDRPLLPSNAGTLGLPLTPSPLKLAVQPTETLNDIRMTLADSPEGYWLGSYCFRRAPAKGSQAKANGASTPAPKGERVGEWTELKEVFEGVPAEERELYISYGESHCGATEHLSAVATRPLTVFICPSLCPLPPNSPLQRGRRPQPHSAPPRPPLRGPSRLDCRSHRLGTHCPGRCPPPRPLDQGGGRLCCGSGSGCQQGQGQQASRPRPCSRGWQGALPGVVWVAQPVHHPAHPHPGSPAEVLPDVSPHTLHRCLEPSATAPQGSRPPPLPAGRDPGGRDHLHHRLQRRLLRQQV